MRSDHKRNQLLTLILIGLIGVGMALVPGSGSPGQAHANGLFSYACEPDGSVTFYYYDHVWHTVSPANLYGPLAMAVASHEHQVIIMEDDISLWALYHNELQIHLNENPDGTKYIIPANSCGPVPTPQYVVMLDGQTLAFAEAQAGGMAGAIAIIAPDGSIFTFAYVEGPGQALAVAQVTRLYASSPYTAGATPATDRRTHVVQPGENLFRISLLYNIPLDRLAAINGITNVNLILVGQILYLE